MKNTFLHHFIEIKAGRHEMLINDEESKSLKPSDWLDLYKTAFSKKEDQESFLYGYGYMEMIIGKDRTMTREEYKRRSSEYRKEYFDQDKAYRDSEYFEGSDVPSLNPGGGSYYM